MCPSTAQVLEPRRLFSGLPTVSIGDVSVTEGHNGTTTAAVVVSLSKPRPSQPVTVNYATRNGTAVAGADYVASSGKLTFAVGETSKTILLPVKGDRIAEAEEFFVVNLQSPKGAKIGDGQGIVTIADDEPRIAIGGAAADEGHSGTTSFSFEVTLSQACDQAVTVNYATEDGSAVVGADYQASSGTVTFAAGETSKTIFIPVVGDRLPEPDKYFFVNLSRASANAAIGSGQGFATILDDEPRISVTGVSDYEGNSGTTPFTFTVSLSAAYDQAVTVNFATEDYTAVAGVDYVSTTEVLTFAPGDATKLVTVQVLGNTTPEAEKYFLVNLSGASANAGIVSSSAYGSIADDDGYVDPYYDYGYYDPGYGYYDYYYYYY